MKSLPGIRSGLLRHPLDQQVLVYDSRDDRVHLLDPTTACVLDLLEEGGWTREGISAELAVRLNVTPSDGFLSLALDELRKADLLDERVTAPSPLADVNRRELVRKLAMTGAAAFLIPTVMTLAATPGYAQGTLSPNCAPCTADAQCAIGNCNNFGACSENNGDRPTGGDCSGVGGGACCSGVCLNNAVCA